VLIIQSLKKDIWFIKRIENKSKCLTGITLIAIKNLIFQ
jgi:hypothetical protein